jgi:integral membrane protein (TIGR01906 family)
MKTKTILLILLLIIIIQFPVIIFLANAKAAAFDLEFHEKEFEKYEPEIENRLAVANDLLFYLKVRHADKSYILPFTKEEKAHLIEVKILMHRFLNISYASITLLAASILIILIFDRKKALKRISFSAVGGGILTLLCSLIFHLIVSADFDAAWTKFHHIFFRLGNWQFPPDYMLVQLYPAQFWIDIINRIAANVLIAAATAVISGILLFWLYLYKEKKMIKFFKSREGIIYKIINY